MSDRDRGMQTALALMAAELRGDREGTAALVADCDYLDEVALSLVPFAAEAARMASRREVPDEALADLASKHLIRLADGG